RTSPPSPPRSPSAIPGRISTGNTPWRGPAPSTPGATRCSGIFWRRVFWVLGLTSDAGRLTPRRVSKQRQPTLIHQPRVLPLQFVSAPLRQTSSVRRQTQSITTPTAANPSPSPHRDG